MTPHEFAVWYRARHGRQPTRRTVDAWAGGCAPGWPAPWAHEIGAAGDGAPCPKCKGTRYAYRLPTWALTRLRALCDTDTALVSVDTTCCNCGRQSGVNLRLRKDATTSAAAIADAHRDAWMEASYARRDVAHATGRPWTHDDPEAAP